MPARLLGIEPSAPSRPTGDGQRMIRVDAREVERIRAMAAAYKDADPHDGEDDAYYERHRSMILGGMA